MSSTWKRRGCSGAVSSLWNPGCSVPREKCSPSLAGGRADSRLGRTLKTTKKVAGIDASETRGGRVASVAGRLCCLRSLGRPESTACSCHVVMCTDSHAHTCDTMDLRSATPSDVAWGEPDVASAELSGRSNAVLGAPLASVGTGVFPRGPCASGLETASRVLCTSLEGGSAFKDTGLRVLGRHRLLFTVTSLSFSSFRFSTFDFFV